MSEGNDTGSCKATSFSPLSNDYLTKQVTTTKLFHKTRINKTKTPQTMETATNNKQYNIIIASN